MLTVCFTKKRKSILASYLRQTGRQGRARIFYILFFIFKWPMYFSPSEFEVAVSVTGLIIIFFIDVFLS